MNVKMKKKIDTSKLPDFSKMTNKEIAVFWESHDVSEFWADMAETDERFIDARPKKSISIRIDEDSLDDLKVVAKKKGLGYQTLMRMWVKERLDTERGKSA